MVFHGHGLGLLSWFLKPGFRHVFVAVLVGDYWMMLDSNNGLPSFEVMAPKGFDLAAYYRAGGFTVIETSQRSVPQRAPFIVATCVGFVKAVLCIRSRALTPFRLYQSLKESSWVPW